MPTVIDLRKPRRSEKSTDPELRGRTVFIYQCSHGHEVRVLANSFCGKTPVPSVGGIACPRCEFEEKYGEPKEEP